MKFLLKNKVYLVVIILSFITTLRSMLVWGTGGVHQIELSEMILNIDSIDNTAANINMLWFFPYPVYVAALFCFGCKECQTLKDYVVNIGFIYPVKNITQILSIMFLTYISPVKPTASIFYSEIEWIVFGLLISSLISIMWIYLLFEIKKITQTKWIIMLFSGVLFYFFILLDDVYFGPLLSLVIDTLRYTDPVLLNIFYYYGENSIFSVVISFLRIGMGYLMLFIASKLINFIWDKRFKIVE